MGAMRSIDVGSALAVSVFRVGSGLIVGKLGPRPTEPVTLWDFEGCPYSQIVREALTELDLEAHVLPCPIRGKRYRADLRARGGGVPFLVDPGDGSALYGAPVIVRHLFARYGAGKAPARLLVPPHVTPLAAATSWLRGRWLGRYARPSRKPDRPLELWSFEASPYCRIAREALTSLEIPYLLHNVGKRSPSRPAFVARSGKMQVPYLVDPNTGQSMFESAEIVAYLERTYGA